MADILQTQYCYVFSDPNSSLIEQTLVGFSQGDPHSIQGIDFDKEDIIKAIEELDAYAATYHDDIPAKIHKYCKHSISTDPTLEMVHGNCFNPVQSQNAVRRPNIQERR